MVYACSVPSYYWANNLMSFRPLPTNFNKIELKIYNNDFHAYKDFQKCRLQNVGHFVHASIC